MVDRVPRGAHALVDCMTRRTHPFVDRVAGSADSVMDRVAEVAHILVYAALAGLGISGAPTLRGSDCAECDGSDGQYGGEFIVHAGPCGIGGVIAGGYPTAGPLF